MTHQSLINSGADVSRMYEHPRDHCGLIRKFQSNEFSNRMTIKKGESYEGDIDPFGFISSDSLSKQFEISYIFLKL